MEYKFKYKFPFYQKFNIILYPIIAVPFIYILFLPRRESMALSKFIFGKITFTIMALFFLYSSYSYIKTLCESKHYSPIIIDDESITFPFEVNGEKTTWKFKDIDSVRFDYYKTSYNIRRHYFTEINKGSERIELYRSWMNHFAFLRLQVLLRKQGIEVEKPI